MSETASEFVACKAWRWMEGMWYRRAHARGVVVQTGVGGDGVYGSEEPEWYRYEYGPRDAICSWIGELLPDTDSPATLGCIEHGLPAAWAVEGVDLVISKNLESGVWEAEITIWAHVIFNADRNGETRKAALAAVLLAALQAAPGTAP